MRQRKLFRALLRRALVPAIGCWLGFGPAVTSTSFGETELECCCDGGSACLLFGCDCGGHGPATEGENADIRSAPCQTEDGAVSFFGRHLGLSLEDGALIAIQLTGQASCTDDSLPDFPFRNPDSPPPRYAHAHRA